MEHLITVVVIEKRSFIIYLWVLEMLNNWHITQIFGIFERYFASRSLSSYQKNGKLRLPVLLPFFKYSGNGSTAILLISTNLI